MAKQTAPYSNDDINRYKRLIVQEVEGAKGKASISWSTMTGMTRPQKRDFQNFLARHHFDCTLDRATWMYWITPEGRSAP